MNIHEIKAKITKLEDLRNSNSTPNEKKICQNKINNLKEQLNKLQQKEHKENKTELSSYCYDLVNFSKSIFGN